MAGFVLKKYQPKSLQRLPAPTLFDDDVSLYPERMNGHHFRNAISIVVLIVAAAIAGGGRALAYRNQASANESGQDANSAKPPDISKWKVYRNEKHGFQVKYPETWAVNSGQGTGWEAIYFRGPYRGAIGQALNVTIQPHMNPGKLSIEEWFGQQLRAVDANKLEAKGCSSVGGRPACFFELKSEKKRFVYTLLHQTDVLSFDYKLGTADSPSYAAIVDSFQVVN